MCRYTIRTRHPLLAAPVRMRAYAPVALATRARPVPLRLVTRTPLPALPLTTRARPVPLRVRTLATQRRLITQAGAYIVTNDGRRIIVGVCLA